MGSNSKVLNIVLDPSPGEFNKYEGFACKSDPYIFIVLDFFSYVSGERVTGEVLLNIPSVLPKGSIKFYSRGVEEIQVFHAVYRNKQLLEETNEVYSLDEIIKEWELELPPGHYVIPFNFKIPSYSPSSFYYSGEDSKGNYIKAEVFYHISVKLLFSNKESGISNSRLFIVKNKKCLEKPGYSIEENAVITGCCFSNKGSTKFKLSVTNTEHCTVGGNVKYKLDPDNTRCRVPIYKVTGNVHFEFFINTRKGEFRVFKTISSIPRATWISPYASIIYEKDFEYLADLKAFSEELNPSSNFSSMMCSKYFVEVCVYYDLVCRKKPHKIKINFHVNPRTSSKNSDPILPRDWNPIELSIVNLIVNTTKPPQSNPDQMAGYSSHETDSSR
jgi:Arrestin (or S-antigen), N-terminal domain